jgi:hypothetical protein
MKEVACAEVKKSLVSFGLMAGVDSLMKAFEEDAEEICGPRYGPGAGKRSQTRFFASCGNALAMALQDLRLPQLRADLLGSQPLIRHRLSPFQAIFSQFAWFRKGRSGHFAGDHKTDPVG